ncbi:MAG: toll/interleukin-1 receptor domain-containing protein [Rhodanobacteraceae bacterium]|nr:toll/interleukin-1 receptor domain-containing protein [Rhodanobacteraceae bacterium]
MEFLSETQWDDLLGAIELRKVVPVIGPSMVRVAHQGGLVPLQPWLATQVAQRLGLPEAECFPHTAALTRTWLAQPGNGQRLNVVQSNVLQALKRIPAEPCEALLGLAGIDDFNLYLSTTPDGLLAQALEQLRPGFDRARHVGSFTMAGMPGCSSDVPEAEPALFHLLGNERSLRFPVWDEDTMELVYALIARRNELPLLISRLREKQLLILGSPADDWVVRFLLRALFENQLSRQQEPHLLFEHPGSLSDGLIVFLQSTLRSAQVVHGSPVDFAQELGLRWRARNAQNVDDRHFVNYLPERPPQNAVFISYASQDLAQAVVLARALQAGGVPVWLDKQRLTSGDAYHTALESAIKHNCRFFVSLISQATEADLAGDPGRKRYFRKERDWAASLHVPGVYFYLPVSFDLPHGQLPRGEPISVTFSEQGPDDAREGISLRRLDAAELVPWVRWVRGLRDSFLRTGLQPAYAR